MMICNNCGAQIIRGKFCAKCGTKISEAPPAELTDSFCASCKAPLKPGARFCRNCGAHYETPPEIPEESAPVVLESPLAPEPEVESDEEQPVCGNCGAPLKPDAKFCRNCGAHYETPPEIPEESVPVVPESPLAPEPEAESDEEQPVCGNCGAPLKPDAKFCRDCGAHYKQPVMQEESVPVVPDNPSVSEPQPESAESEKKLPSAIPESPAKAVQPDVKQTFTDTSHSKTTYARTEAAPPATSPPLNGKSEATPLFKSGNYGNEPGNTKFKVFIVIAAILLVVVAGIAVGYFFPRSGKEHALPASILVKTEPGNVYITLDGQSIGMTDDSGELLYDGIAPGLHEVQARLDGYTEVKQSLQFTPGEQQEARLALNRLNGIITVNVDVRNADISINGAEFVGNYSDRVTDMEIPVGSYDVTVSKSGYQTTTRPVDIRAEIYENIFVSLDTVGGREEEHRPDTAKTVNEPENTAPKSKPKETLPARLMVKTDPGNAYITLDGRPIGKTDDSGNLSYNGVTPGSHEVLARAEGYAEATQNLQFTSGGQQEARLTLARLTGNLSVKVNVGNADIRISGAGVLSDHNDYVSALELPAGSYTVTVSKTGYRTVTGTADVQANGNKNISVTLEATYTGPTSGVMVWEGDVRGATTVTIENGKANTGRVTGNPLPGVPCSILLSDYKNAVIAYMPGPESDYKRVILRVNSKGKVSVQLRWTVLQ